MTSSLFSKEKRLFTIEIFVGIIFMIMFSVGMMKTSIQPYDTWIETWAYYTDSVVLLIVIMLRGGWRLCKKWPVVAIGGAYLGYAINYLVMHNSEYGVEYRRDLIWQYISKLLLILIAVDVMLTHNLTKLNREHIVYSSLLILAVVLATSLNWRSASSLVFPFVALYITPISKKCWNNILLCLSIGCYITFAVLMIQSLATVPYGELGRYYIGTFVTPGGACHVAMGGFLSSIYIFDRALRLQHNNLVKRATVIISLVMSALALFSVSLVGNRSMQLASAAAIITYALTYDWGSKEKNKRIRRRIGICLGIMFFLLIVFIVLLIKLNVDAKKVATLFPGIYLQTKVGFWIERLQTFGNRNSILGVFPDGSIINIFDRFASERVSIWYETIHKIKLTPIEGVGSAHSIYLQWMVQYGFISGVLLSISLLAGTVITCMKHIKMKNEFVFPCLCFVSFAAYAGYTASTTLLNVMGYMLLFMQYPLLVQMDEE